MVLIRAEFENNPPPIGRSSSRTAGVMNSIVQGYGDFMNHEHTKAVGAVAYVEHDGAGTFRCPKSPACRVSKVRPR